MDERERIVFLMEKMQIKNSQFTAKIGVQPSTISNILAGRNKPSLEIMQRILHAYPKVSSSWLIMGVGEPFIEKDYVEFDTPTQDTNASKQLSNNEIRPPKAQAIRNLFQNEKDIEGGANFQTLSPHSSRMSAVFKDQPTIDNAINHNRSNSEKRIIQIIILYSDMSYEVK